jgi:Ala-tRNA(Pro) deacylase
VARALARGRSHEEVTMFANSVREYLDNHHARYVTISHQPAFTAQEVAAAAHIPGRMMAKTVMVKIDGEMAMVVLPADRRIDLAYLKKVTKAHSVRLASEEEFTGMFPGCEVGAMPPLGELYGLEVYAARELTEDDEIAFNAGTFTEVVRLPYGEFRRLTRPRVLDLCLRD